VLYWNLSAASEFLDLLRAILLPVGYVWVVADTEWAALLSKSVDIRSNKVGKTYCEDDGSDVVIEP
jgi:hypothetical protein